MATPRDGRDRIARGDKRKARILIVNDHLVIRQALVQIVNDQPDMQVCGVVSDGQTALREAPLLKPDIAIVDLSAGGNCGTSFIEELSSRFREISVIVMSMHTEAFYAERAFRAGARGFIVKGGSSQDLLRAVRSVLAGQK